MQGTIAEKLNIIPEKKIVDFYEWKSMYYSYILHMYNIFEKYLENIEPFNQPDFFTNEKVFQTFVIMLYKSSYSIL